MTSTTSTRRPRRMAREPNSIPPASQDAPSSEEGSAGADKAVSAREPSKTEKVLSLLKGERGASLDELTEATGWLPHTTRAALTGLKKKGHTIERTKVDGVSRYTLAEPVAG